jgi:hypothetical protein
LLLTEAAAEEGTTLAPDTDEPQPGEAASPDDGVTP